MEFISSFCCDEKPWGIVENIDGNFIVCHGRRELGIRNKEGSKLSKLMDLLLMLQLG